MLRVLQAILLDRNGVRVMDGLKIKYNVFKVDTNETVYNCFVLRPSKDKAAIEALKRYAEVTENKQLSEDIMVWIKFMESEGE